MCVWNVSQVEKYIARHGTRAVYAPSCVDPKPMAAVLSKLAIVQFSESIPWLFAISILSKYMLSFFGDKLTRKALPVHLKFQFSVPVSHRRCPMWNTLILVSFFIDHVCKGLGFRLTSTCQMQSYSTTRKVPTSVKYQQPTSQPYIGAFHNPYRSHEIRHI